MTTSVRRIWQVWALVCLASSAIQALSIGFDPAFNQDEVQIVDMGRVALEPDTDWALTWNIAAKRPISPTAHLGPAIQELAYRITQPGHTGPRLMAMLGAVVAATFLLGWLLARETPPLAALILACAFLLDPAFTTSYREGRVDSWAFASCLLTCWLIRSEIGNQKAGERRRLTVFLAGACLVTGPFFWPSAFMLVPLALLEFAYLLHSKTPKENKWAWPALMPTILVFSAGSLIAAAVLLTPIFLDWDNYLISLQAALVGQKADAAKSESLFDLAATYDPIITMALIIAAFFKREYGALAALGLALVLMYQTRVYPSRAIYLLPFAYAIVASAATWVWARGLPSIHRAVMARLLAVLLIWNGGLVLVVRPLTAFAKDSSNDLRYQLAALESAIGAGPHKVLLEDWASYYAARNLGWKIYRSPSLFSGPMYSNFMKSMDYVIVSEKPFYDLTNKLVEADPEFELQETIHFPAKQDYSFSLGPVKVPIYQNNYPNLLVFKKIRH